jgi:bifunctional UDP-N-acetylglucosamine pyrophosphorylase/glucosamine-1-phosphate N-acetyltransferase
MEEKIRIVILAAGLGTRMRSRKAKVLHEAGGLRLIEHVVNTAVSVAPAENIAVVVGHQAEQVKTVLEGRGLRFAVQTQQLGTGDALAVSRDAIGSQEGLLVVLYGDTPLLESATIQALIRGHGASGAAATVITTMLDDPTGYGRVIVDENGRVRAIVEQKVANGEQRTIRQINSGIYCFDAALLWKHLAEIRPNPVSKEYYLTDIVEILNAAGYHVAAMLHPESTELLGINTRIELAEVDQVFRDRKVRDLMLSGVTIEKPETVTIDTAVTVGMDTIIEPHVRLLGSTQIGENCRIGAGAIIRGSKLADSAEILPYTYVNYSSIGEGATIGPFAHLRPANEVAHHAHIGNFVELKKTRFGAGSKAGHLSYLGDSVVGAGTNIGAGTITCNYDGVSKYPTTIGERAFVGSNSILVAPVTLNSGAYIAAGSVITEDVPADALAVGRTRQVNKEGWARRRREKSAAKASSDSTPGR